MKTVLIMVMSVPDSPYKEMMKESMDGWDSIAVDGVKTIFYCGSYSHGMYVTPRVVYFPVQDILTNVSRKTQMAFQWALQKFEFDYIFRPNASSYVNKKELIKHIQTLPDSVAQGLIAPYEDAPGYMWGVGYIISRDIVKMLCENDWDYNKMDDVAMSLLLHSKGIKLNGNGKQVTIHKENGYYDILVYNGQGAGRIKSLKELNTPGQYLYRCKQDLRRHEDIQIMKELHLCLNG